MYGEIDFEDAILSPLFVIAAAVSTGLATVTIFDTSLGGTMFSAGGQEIGYASVISVAVLGAAWVTNQPDLDNMDDMESYAVIGTAIAVVGVPLIPALHSFVTGNDLVSLIVMCVQAAGFYAVSYLG